MSTPVEPGVVLAGKYRVERILGRGGMGVVVAARHLQLDELVALKFLLPDAVGNAEALVRFEREARAAVKIKSEHIARVSDVGTLDWGAPYMVMEYLQGRDLGAVVSERGPLPLEDVAEYVLQACEALAEAHALGVIHRDLKPANLFLTERADGSPCVKVLDFGISKLTGFSTSDDNTGMTRTSAVIGSPLYMSPEQLSSSRDVDTRTDLWALGVIVFELLTARAPYYADTMPQLVTAVLHHPPASLKELRPDLPDAVQGLIQWCLEKDRENRVPSVAEFAMRLAEYGPPRCRVSVERIRRISQAAGLLAMNPTLPVVAVGSSTVGGFGRTGSTASSNKWWAAGAVLLLGIAGTAVLYRTQDDATEAPSARPAADIQAARALGPAPPVMSESVASRAPPAGEQPAARPSSVASAGPARVSASEAAALGSSGGPGARLPPKRVPAPSLVQARPAKPAESSTQRAPIAPRAPAPAPKRDDFGGRL